VTGAGRQARVDVADALLLLTVGIWGLNVTVVKLLLRNFQPLELSILRFTAAAAIFFLVVWIRERDMRIARRDWGWLVLAAVSGITLNQVCFVYSLKFTTATNLSLLLASTQVWAALLVAAARMELVGPRHWAGIGVSMLGVAAIVLFRPGGVQLNVNLLGDLLGIGVAFTWATYSVALRPLVRRNSVFRVSAWVLLLGTLAIVPLGVPQMNWAQLEATPAATWGLYAYSMLGAVVLTNIFWYVGMRRLGPARGTLYANIQPFIGVLFAALILHEQVGAIQLLGGFLVVGGVLISRFRSRAVPVEAAAAARPAG
jgi:drug/metabolite transporter (DMT)-like permease